MTVAIEPPTDLATLQGAWETARRALATLELRAAGYTVLTMPANLQIELENKRAEVASLAANIQAARQTPPDAPTPDDFVNRETEFRQLTAERLRAAHSPYILVCAPAGYGKTCLLRRLMTLLAAPQWESRYVAAAPPAPLDIVAIAQSIAPAAPLAPADAIPALCNAVLHALTAAPGDDPAMLLLFDDLDRLDAPTAQWLCALLDALYRRTRLNNREVYTVRVILAGRDTDAFWEGYRRAAPRLPAPQRIALAPFDARALQDMVWAQARALRLHDALDDDAVTQIGDELLYFSGGHPGVARALVDDLARQFFGVGSVAEYFAQNRERWAQECLAPVADALTAALPPALAQAARTLSVFRRVNANTVQSLVDAGLLPATCKAVDLLGDMVKARLLAPPSLREPFFRDLLTRRVLTNEMAGRSAASRAQYARLNQHARALYAGWIAQGLQDPHLGPSQRLLAIVEWLYHTLLGDDVAPAQLQAGLQAHLAVVCAAPDSGYVRDLIGEEIRQDAELGYLLRRHLGPEGVALACEWVSG